MLAISVFWAIADAIRSIAPGRHVPLDAPATPEAILRAVEDRAGEGDGADPRRACHDALREPRRDDQAGRPRRPRHARGRRRGQARARPAPGWPFTADGAFRGTIGGGALEWQALAEAQAMLAAPTGRACACSTRPLGPISASAAAATSASLERLGAEDLPRVEAMARAGS